MSTHYPRATRLYALIGDAVLDLSASAVERLETALAETPSKGAAGRHGIHERCGHALLMQRRLVGVAAILEILHAEHLSQHDGGSADLLGERLTEGLIVAGRELLKMVGETPGS